MTKRTVIAAFLAAGAIVLGLKIPFGSTAAAASNVTVATAATAACLAAIAVTTAAENLGSEAEGFDALRAKLLGDPILAGNRAPHV